MEIHSAWLVRALAESRHRYSCDSCESRMFVKSTSGLCPVCWDRRRRRIQEIEEIVANEVADAACEWEGAA